jgi:phospho-N-acetylmuramoyl-pentapeptide-transferase
MKLRPLRASEVYKEWKKISMNSVLIAAAALISFGITALLGKWMIPFLHRINFGQTIRSEGPAWHKKKSGTPIMGGLMFIIGSIVAVAICVPLYFDQSGESPSVMLMNVKIVGGMLMACGFGAIGFLDDYIKAVKKRNLGLNVRQKLVLQFLVAAAYLYSLYRFGAGSRMLVPFAGSVDWGIWYWVICLLGIVGMVNAVNFTDGIDGLNASVTFFVSLTFLTIAGFLRLTPVGIFAAAAAGGCLGFLIWNFNPAKVFMGDTGSLFLGGIVCALGFALNLPILILLAGIVYLAEILSVVLQVLYFKATHGKRLFKMSPIHHHFELCGWSEVKICAVFSIVTVIFGAVSVLLAVFGL